MWIKCVILKYILLNDILNISYVAAFKCTTQDLTDL